VALGAGVAAALGRGAALAAAVRVGRGAALAAGVDVGALTAAGLIGSTGRRQLLTSSSASSAAAYIERRNIVDFLPGA
jgi:hypothetical protein